MVGRRWWRTSLRGCGTSALAAYVDVGNGYYMIVNRPVSLQTDKYRQRTCVTLAGGVAQ